MDFETLVSLGKKIKELLTNNQYNTFAVATTKDKQNLAIKTVYTEANDMARDIKNYLEKDLDYSTDFKLMKAAGGSDCVLILTNTKKKTNDSIDGDKVIDLTIYINGLGKAAEYVATVYEDYTEVPRAAGNGYHFSNARKRRRKIDEYYDYVAEEDIDNLINRFKNRFSGAKLNIDIIER